MQTITLADRTVPALGMGTWGLGEGSAAQRQQERASLQWGLDHGLTVIDTAEMYGDGAAETLVGQAIQGTPRDQLTLISKFYPWHATARKMRSALTASLKRLHTDYLDVYLLHWRGTTPLRETLAGLAELQQAGLIRAYGVSNFDVADLKEAAGLPGGSALVANEVLYNLAARGIEVDLLPYHRAHHLTTIGYSPFGSGNGQQIALPRPVQALAKAKGLSPWQLMLAWTLRTGQVLTIPKAASLAHMQANHAALAVTWTPAELAVLDHAFPAPTHKVPLAMI
ncbi:aldo/keto reductase [Lacticaseibacillus daqingensis]|uniref:aldo/keto reductase n=1 Tax=Lacticaseibacillus daqingensis TaxID=2486014 RepID=UPI000F76C7AF|nr:aldo/keto reductase [Lacticaseibacillus daqingensis]